jgi:hypothetical protein
MTRKTDFQMQKLMHQATLDNFMGDISSEADNFRILIEDDPEEASIRTVEKWTRVVALSKLDGCQLPEFQISDDLRFY